MKNKTAYFITSSAAPTEEYIQTAIAGFRGFISCFENVTEAGIIAGCGAAEKGEVKEMAAFQKAYKGGRSFFVLSQKYALNAYFNIEYKHFTYRNNAHIIKSVDRRKQRSFRFTLYLYQAERKGAGSL